MEAIRDILNRDRAWCAFALADLEPEHAPYSSWSISDQRDALALVYSGFDPPLLFATGAADGLLDKLRGEYYVSLRDGLLDRMVDQGWQVKKRLTLHRMVFSAGGIGGGGPIRRLGPSDFREIDRLYADGDATGERPPFFTPRSLEHGVYYGARLGGELVA